MCSLRFAGSAWRARSFILITTLYAERSRSSHPFMKSTSSAVSNAMPAFSSFLIRLPSYGVSRTTTRFSSGSSLRLFMSSSSSMGHAMMPSTPLVMSCSYRDGM